MTKKKRKEKKVFFTFCIASSFGIKFPSFTAHPHIQLILYQKQFPITFNLRSHNVNDVLEYTFWIAIAAKRKKKEYHKSSWQQRTSIYVVTKKKERSIFLALSLKKIEIQYRNVEEEKGGFFKCEHCWSEKLVNCKRFSK